MLCIKWPKACRTGFAAFVVLAVLSPLTVKAQVTQPKCAKYNEYCQHHWECCSNSCASFLYRCTRGYNEVPQSSVQTNNLSPPVQTELQQRFGSPVATLPANAGSADDSLITNRFGTPQKKCANYNEYCQNHWDCCSNSCMSFLYKCTRPATQSKDTDNGQIESRFGAGSSQPRPAGPNIIRGTYEDVIALAFGLPSPQSRFAAPIAAAAPTTRDPPRQTGRPAFGNTQAEITTNRIDQVSTQPATQNPGAVAQGACKQIGQLCHLNEECCTKLCHSYLSKCVT